MTNEEAIQELKVFLSNGDFYYLSGDAANLAIEALEQEPRWIPVSEKLPEEETDVMICNSKGDIEIARGSVFDDGTWEWYTSGWHYGEVVAWMPLPEPYKAESEE